MSIQGAVTQPEEGNKYWFCYNMNEPWKHASERSHTQKHDSVYMKCPESANP